jgi:hypothetical protein
VAPARIQLFATNMLAAQGALVPGMKIESIR